MNNDEEYTKVKAMVEHLHVGVIKHLETKPGIFKVDYVEKRPIERPVIISWEQRNTTLLPEDLKNFFMTSNGFHLEWSVKMENGPLPIGCLHVNAIGQLTCLAQPSETVSQVTPSIQDLDFDSDGEKGHVCEVTDLFDELNAHILKDDISSRYAVSDVRQHGCEASLSLFYNQAALSKPTFGGGLRIFELDSLDGLGKVCLVYYQPNDGPDGGQLRVCAKIGVTCFTPFCQPSCPPSQTHHEAMGLSQKQTKTENIVKMKGEIKSEIWFLDRALCWHFIAATFMDYFRLMVMHLGLPHWLYAVTEIGLPPQSKQWFHLYVPTRLEIDAHPPQDLGSVNIVGLGLKVTFDPTKIFKGKNDRKKTTTGNNTTSGQNINQNQNRNKKPQVSSARSASLSGTKPLSSSPSSQLLVKSSR